MVRMKAKREREREMTKKRVCSKKQRERDTTRNSDMEEQTFVTVFDNI